MTTPALRRVRAAAATLALGALAATGLVLPSAANAADAPPQFQNTTTDYAHAQAGDYVKARIGDLLPTQPSLGYDEVGYKLGRYLYGKKSQDPFGKKFGDWCEAAGLEDVASAEPNARIDDPSSFTCTLQPGQETTESANLAKTVVVGPGAKLYLTDGHHTLTSLAELPDGGLDAYVRLRVDGNFSDLGESAFWEQMIQHKWTWLTDANGQAIEPKQLPQSLGLANFQNDEYRGLLYFARDIGYAELTTLPFQEFYWGAWLRDRNPQPAYLSTLNRNDWQSYLDTVKALSEEQAQLPASAVLNGGFTAAELGQFAAGWNNGKAIDKGEYAKLAKPLSDAKPGKLAHLINYKTSARTPLAPAKPAATLDGHSISVVWNVAAINATPVNRYMVTLRSSAGNVRTLDSATTSLVFTDVPAGSYTATVVAKNGAGSSQVSAESNTIVVSAPPVVTRTLTAAKPVVTGSHKVGKTLRAKTGAWKPSAVKLSYQWLRNGTAIKGQTKSSYKLVKSDRRKKISVRVTGKLSGYTTVSRTSTARTVK